MSILLFAFQIPKATYPLHNGLECRPRQGLPNVLSKLKAGHAIKIAYLGGSITYAPGWRLKSRKWFQKQYPNARVDEIHAALGGTGSDLGVFRLQQDVLRHKPDLLFVEFAVNDHGASPERIQKAMEGIVRQTWQANEKIDICFIYTINPSALKEIQAGHFQPSASAMEEVAEHYGIPSIHMGIKVAEMVKAGDLIFKAPKPKSQAITKPMIFSSDGTHPFVETGHELYMQSIIRSMQTISRKGSPGKHPIPAALRADNWEGARLVPLAEDVLKGEWTKLDEAHVLSRRFKRNMPQIYMASEPSSAISFTFEGTAVGVFDIKGPDGGKISIQMDGKEIMGKHRIARKHRLSGLKITEGLEYGEHTVTFTLQPNIPDKRKILKGRRDRHDFDKNPERYKDSNWYIGALMLIGKLK